MSIDTADAGEPLVASWARFFKTYCREQINEAAIAQSRSITVNFFDLHRHDPALADYLLDHPVPAIAYATEAIATVDVPVEPRPLLRVRVVCLPETRAREVSLLREEDLGRLVSVRGLVRRSSKVFPVVAEAVFQCSKCGAFIKEPQDEYMILKEPLECYESQGGGGHDASFKLILSETRGRVSRSVDTQRVDLQELPDTVLGAREPGSVIAYVQDDLVGQVWPGDRIIVNGVYRGHPRRLGNMKTKELDTYLEVHSIEVEQVAYEEIRTTPEEEARFRALARDPTLFDKLVQSFAPSIHGLYEVKLAILLQLFGAVEKNVGGVRKRGNTHILLLGEPGKAKTRLLRVAAELSPRGVFATATTASKVGLTYAVVQDEKGMGQSKYVLSAGAAVLADKGQFSLDEPDKVDPKELNGLLEAMEDQKISVNKGNITGVSLNARFAGLFGANFKGGRYAPKVELGDQVPFADYFMSRVDCTFLLLDVVDEEEDRETIRTVNRAHLAGGISAARAAGHTAAIDDEVEAEVRRFTEPILGADEIRKYIAFARRTCTPLLTPALLQRLENKYVELRRLKSKAESPVPLGIRQEEGIIRMAEQSARARLSPVVEDEDLERALRIFREGYLKLATNAKGEVDMDRAMGAPSMDMRSAINCLLDVVRDLSTDKPPGMEPSEVAILIEAERRGLPKDRGTTYFLKLKDRGRVYFSGHGYRLSGDPRPATTRGSESA